MSPESVEASGSSGTWEARGRGRRPLLLGLLGVAIATGSGMWIIARTPPVRHGDGVEYLATVEAFHNHWTPDLRAEDFASLEAVLHANALTLPPDIEQRMLVARDGRTYGWHFFLYPALATPFRAFLGVEGGNPMAAMLVLNALCLGVAIGFALFHGTRPRFERALYLGLVAIGPVWWFLGWTHPEVFSWSAAVVSVIAIRDERYPLGAVAAALGAMQNPPLLALAIPACAMAWSSRGIGHALWTGLAAAPGLLPQLFSLWAFGVPNPVVAFGVAGPEFVTVGRFVSFLTDLNQGMLAHIPFLLLLWIATGLSALRRRDWLALGLFALPLPMMIVSLSQGNWNGGTAGIMRYAIWMIPVMAWAVVDYLPRSRAVVAMLIAAIALEAPIALSRGGEEDYYKHSPLARQVLAHAPWLYCPDPEIFVERSVRADNIDYSSLLPFGYRTRAGEVTKVLLRAPTTRDDWAAFEVEARYLDELLDRYGDRDGLYYVHPPAGAVRHAGVAPQDWLRWSRDLVIEVAAAATEVSTPRLVLPVRVENTSDRTFPAAQGIGSSRIAVSYHVRREGEMLVWDGLRTPIDQPLEARQSREVLANVLLPEMAGRYTLELDVMAEGVAWLGLSERLGLRVAVQVEADEAKTGRYRARVTPAP